MFEKEAEDWIKNNLHSKEEDYIKAFKDGAVFGYDKANEELKELCMLRKMRIEDLEEQIKKMKCCGNCGKWENCEKDEMFSQDICGDWELER